MVIFCTQGQRKLALLGAVLMRIVGVCQQFLSHSMKRWAASQYISLQTCAIQFACSKSDWFYFCKMVEDPVDKYSMPPCIFILITQGKNSSLTLTSRVSYRAVKRVPPLSNCVLSSKSHINISHYPTDFNKQNLSKYSKYKCSFILGNAARTRHQLISRQTPRHEHTKPRTVSGDRKKPNSYVFRLWEEAAVPIVVKSILKKVRSDLSRF